MEDKGFDYINVIPFIDIMLVLLTIVLMTSTFIAAGGIPVELPKASSRQEALRTQTIEIDRKGTVYLNSKPVAAGSLTPCMCSMDREMPILIKADRNIELQVFVDVLDEVKTMGFKKVSLQTEQRA